MDCGKLLKKNPVEAHYFLGSYAFSFRPVQTLGCSFAVMVFAFADSGQHPAFILVDASARQFHFLWRNPGFRRFFVLSHFAASNLASDNMRINLTVNLEN
jgi:hypothetical protein